MIGFIFLLYAIIVGWLILAKKPMQEDVVSNHWEPVSIIIAYRNEIDNLEGLIKGIENQSIINKRWEVILVNDHSTDGSFEFVQQLVKDSKLIVQHINLTDGEGKKAAISLGVKCAQYELIVCTDADCKFHFNWLETMIQPFVKPGVKMVLGAVRLIGSKGWFQKLQEIEFSSLMAMTILTCRRKRAIMSNGANYAFRKTAFNESDAYSSNSTVNTGDDVFLLHSFKRKFGKSCILFLEKENSVVNTATKNSFSSFFEQRIRWASKSKSYKDLDTLKIGVIIFLANLSVLWIFLGSILQLYSLQFFLGCFLFKWLLDLLLIQQLPLFIRPKAIVKWTFLLSILYPFYSVGIALLSLFHRPQWKGRKI
mgnify:CR=1 FL=1|tara:strand:- start:192 stop:1292 length:1101 start_codon:yes stop_codon:yes gene_type:complete